MVWTGLASYPLQKNWPWWNNPPISKASMASMNDSETQERGVLGVKIRIIFRGSMSPDLPRDLRFRRSIRISISTTCTLCPYPRYNFYTSRFWLKTASRTGASFSSYFTTCSSKTFCIILAVWKSLKYMADRMYTVHVYYTQNHMESALYGI